MVMVFGGGNSVDAIKVGVSLFICWVNPRIVNWRLRASKLDVVFIRVPVFAEYCIGGLIVSANVGYMV